METNITRTEPEDNKMLKAKYLETRDAINAGFEFLIPD